MVFHLLNLSPFHTRIGPVVVDIRRFLKFVNVFLLFRYYLPFEKSVALHLNKLESLSPKDALCQVWLKLAREEDFKKFCQYILTIFVIISPLKRV